MVPISILLEILLLGWMSLQDFRTQQIYSFLLSIFTITGMVLSISLHGWRYLLAASVCGVWILAIGYITRKISKGGIGWGDIWVMASMPFWESGNHLWGIYVLAVIFSGIHSLYVFLSKKSQNTIAFVPWVGVSCVIMNTGSYL